MKSWLKNRLSLCCVLLIFSSVAIAEPTLPKYPLPVMITSVGQAPDGYAVSVVAKRLNLPLKYDTLLAPGQVHLYKTLMISFGVSLKGFGAAGINLDTETARAAALIQAAKQHNVKLIGLHTGGEGRRDAMSNHLLQLYADKMDLFIVYRESNKDGFFSALEKKNIPIITLNKMVDIQNVLKTLFVQ